MKIFAHRGIFDKYPENSLRAFVEALDNNFSVETDLQITRDNDFILIHDDSLKRLIGKDIPVSDLTLKILQKQHYIDRNNKQLEDTLITFKEYCEMFKKKNYDLFSAIQVKAESQTYTGLNKVSEYFEKFDLYDRAFIFDLTIESARRLRKINSKIKIALIVSDKKFESTIYSWEDIKGFDFDIVWAAEFRNLYRREWIAEVKSSGRLCYAMSPDVHKAPHILHQLAYKGYEKTWKDLIAWKVDGICTDLPFQLREFMNSLLN